MKGRIFTLGLKFKISASFKKFKQYKIIYTFKYTNLLILVTSWEESRLV